MLYRDLPLPDGGSIVRIGAGSWVGHRAARRVRARRAAAPARAASPSSVSIARRARSSARAGASRSVPLGRVRLANLRVHAHAAAARPRVRRATTTPPRAEPVAVLGYETWQAAFSGDASRRRQLVRINGQLTRIVGVMPEGYAFPETAELWLPLRAADSNRPATPERASTLRAALARGLGRGGETELTALVQRVSASSATATSEQIPSAVSVLSFQRSRGAPRHGHFRRLEPAVALDSAAGRRQRRQPAAGAHERAHERDRRARRARRAAAAARRADTLENVILCVARRRTSRCSSRRRALERDERLHARAARRRHAVLVDVGSRRRARGRGRGISAADGASSCRCCRRCA